ncbi:unnamed protein product [Moneuplotes crassus]|uniref:Uncharacterized protein n=1 Tax=Euplotes crassus TaxID=5936 RepID=A0AAD1UKG6_EUPCR|nr:unnamed protein product [Moneuplotes crassus]
MYLPGARQDVYLMHYNMMKPAYDGVQEDKENDVHKRQDEPERKGDLEMANLNGDQKVEGIVKQANDGERKSEED